MASALSRLREKFPFRGKRLLDQGVSEERVKVGIRVFAKCFKILRHGDRIQMGNPGLGGAHLATTGFDGWLTRMGDGEGLAGFRGPMLSALAAYARRHGADALADAAGALRARIAGAMALAPKRPGRGPDLERYLGEDHFTELVGWLVDRERRREQAER